MANSECGLRDPVRCGGRDAPRTAGKMPALLSAAFRLVERTRDRGVQSRTFSGPSTETLT
jgi:hypothetical protein